MPITISRADTDAKILACYAVMAELRPSLNEEDFLSTIRRMEPEGFRLAFLSSDGTVKAVVGYRIIEMLRTGKMLEIDDLVTAESARSSGFGELLFNWTVEEARSSGCSVVELDSAVHRADAHRFYFRQRMHVLAFHFSTTLS